MRKLLTVLTVLILVACVSSQIKPISGISFELINKTDALAYYMVYWVDCEYSEYGEPCNIAGGELQSGESISIDNNYKLGEYRIEWRNKDSKKVLTENYDVTEPQNILSELKFQVTKTVMPNGIEYTTESPVDPYEMYDNWLIPEDACDYYEIEELGGSIVLTCFLQNPDTNAEYKMGMIGVEITESGEPTDKILIFSIMDSHKMLETYVWCENVGCYEFLKKEYIGEGEGV